MSSMALELMNQMDNIEDDFILSSYCLLEDAYTTFEQTKDASNQLQEFARLGQYVGFAMQVLAFLGRRRQAEEPRLSDQLMLLANKFKERGWLGEKNTQIVREIMSDVSSSSTAWKWFLTNLKLAR